MAEIPHILSPMTAPWCSWVMLALLLCAVLSEWFQPGVITRVFDSLKVRQDRLYKEAPTNIQAQLLISIFRIGTPAMAVCLCCCPANRFSFTAFAVSCGMVFGAILVKMLCNVLLDYTFQITRSYGDMYEHYANLFARAVVAMYPVVLLCMHLSSTTAIRWMLGAVAALFIGLWLYRSASQYIRTPLALIYILAYTATLEVLPMAGIVLLSAKTISIL